MSNVRSDHWRNPLLVSCLLLAGIWGDRQLFHLPVGDPDAYHAAIRAVADQVPYRIGEWVGVDEQPPPAAVALLRPNFLLCRRFQNRNTQERATVLIVQCRDARDMGSHYPPVCYPANGWTQHESARRNLTINGVDLPTTLYCFRKQSIERYEEVRIFNFFVRADGGIDSGHEGVREAAANPRMKDFGAGQVQVILDGSMESDRMEDLFKLLVEAVFPVLDAIRQGASQ